MAIIDYEDKIHKIVNNDDHSEFIFDFLSVYDKIARSTITKLKKGSNNLSKTPGEVYLKNKLYFKRVDSDLLEAYNDLSIYVDELKSEPRFIMVTDYNKLVAKDTKTNDTLDIEFKQLPKYFEFFLPWNGIEKVDFEKENPADIKAAERFARLYDVIIKDNEGIKDNDEYRHGLNLFLVRLLFCLFAEDTGIFKKGLFTNTLKSVTSEDGHDFNEVTSELFEFLDKKDRNDDEAGWLREFPYVDGQMFIEKQLPLHFTANSRNAIIKAGESIRWETVNPDILGSMLQAVASEDVRSHLGMHYTSVPNIMKVIKPLFLDDLNKTFEDAKGSIEKLNTLLTRMSKIRFMDPACGSGNFLIITYKELRKLEIKILSEQRKLNSGTFYVPSVDLGQFYGIEIDDFACDVTRLSLWIVDHQMNKELSKNYVDVVRPTLPLSRSGEIKCGNSLRIDWGKFLPHEKNDEVYIFGNPPYLGYSLQNSSQKKDMKNIFYSPHFKNYKRLDYISGWFYKASLYISNSSAKSAFVTTNSINQGEQVVNLWGLLLKRVQIIFANPSFIWKNNAKKNAGVIVSIVGIASISEKYSNKKIFIGNSFYNSKDISPYLTVGSSSLIVKPSYNSISKLPKITNGSRPVDDGHLILSTKELTNLKYNVPNVIKIVKRMVGSQELLKNIYRYALWMNKDDYINFKKFPDIENRVDAVRQFRIKGGQSAQSVKDIPWAFFLRKEYNKNIMKFKHSNSKHMINIIIPRVSSGYRYYLPMGLVNENTLISDSAMAIYNGSIFLFGILNSKMHMLWLRNIGGKLKNDFRYSGLLVYNTFPVPKLSTRRKNEIEDLTLNILAIREEEKGTLAELYGSPLAEKSPKPMNERLLKAHQELDKVVDRAYKTTDFKDDNERLELLLKMYSEMKESEDK